MEGSLERFKLTADELTKRRRKGRMIEFHDYDELYFKGLTIDQFSNAETVSFAMGEVISLTPFSEGNSNVANEMKLPGESDENLQMDQHAETPVDKKVLGNKLNRVLVDDVRINFKLPENQPIVLSADYAKILTDTMIIRFEGNVAVNAAKCRISSAVAIWSNEYNGLFFPEYYRFNNRSYSKPAFFQISNTGSCRSIRPVHVVEYADKLDAVEDEMLASMPESVRLIFGLMGATIQNGQGHLFSN